MIVAIIGRPNAGKSTLFNKLTKQRSSIVSATPGVTRDRLYGEIKLDDEDARFTVVDTGGFETDDMTYQPFADNLVWKQTKLAIDEADVVLFLFDGQSGLHPHDRELHRYIRESNKAAVYAVNKVDGKTREDVAYEFFSLGLEEVPICISAAHSRNLNPLMSAVVDKLEESTGKTLRGNLEEDDGKEFRLALIGRPNAGKSSILNRLVGEERSLVSPVAGTTRDTVHSTFLYNQQNYKVLDTAGIRRKTKIKELLESQSTFQSINALQMAHMVIYVIDAIEGIKDQDARLLNMAYDRRRAIVLVVNKWDLVPSKDAKTMKQYEENLRRQLGDLGFIPIHFMSCLQNQRVHKLLSVVEDIAQESRKLIERKRLEEVLERAVMENPPVMDGVHRKPAKFQYIKQTRVMPPTIMIRCNKAMLMKTAYKRYLRNRLKKELGFQRIPVRMILQGKDNQDRVQM